MFMVLWYIAVPLFELNVVHETVLFSALGFLFGFVKEDGFRKLTPIIIVVTYFVAVILDPVLASNINEILGILNTASTLIDSIIVNGFPFGSFLTFFFLSRFMIRKMNLKEWL